MEQLLTLVVDFSVLHAICHSSRNPSVPLVSRYRSQRKITTDPPPHKMVTVERISPLLFCHVLTLVL
jgi:hypothetical protein